MSGEVHNHGPAEGRGLDCGERLVDGRLVGHCVSAPTPEVDLALVEAAVLAAWPAYADYPHRVTQMADDLRPHLAAVLEPYVQQRVAEALEGAAVAVEDCGLALVTESAAEGYALTAAILNRAARIVREAKP